MASACEAAIVAIGVSHGCRRRPSLVAGTLRPTTAAKALPQSLSSFISLVPTAPLLNRAAAPSAAAAAAVGGAAGGRHAVRGGKKKGGASKRSPPQQVRAQEGGAEEAVGVEVADDESQAVKELLEAAAALGVSGEVSVAPVGETPVAAAASTGIEVDAVAEADLKENGFRSTRRTKLICTIGPASCSFEQLEALASGGMNVARLNMCHGTHEWHRGVIQSVRRLNAEKGYSVAVMMDTEGSEIHMGDLGGLSSCKAEDGEEWTFTVRNYPAGALPPQTIQVNYDGFVDDVQEGDEINVDGGMVRFEVLSKIGPDVRVRVIDPGLLLPRAGITFFRRGRLVRARNAMLPTVSSKDWIDIDFGIAEGVDFIAISFVKSPEVLTHLRSYINARSPNRYIGLIAKIESSDSLPRLPDIVRASDGAMVARGDLGAQIPLELVPTAQEDVVRVCRQLNKPVIVASQLLESMIEFPTPTRAEVADVSEAVRQKADALMLSGESAMGQYPDKALSVARSVAARTEQWTRDAATSAAAAAARSGGSSTGVLHGAAVGDLPLLQLSQQLPDRISEQLCSAAALMATNLQADAIFVYTRRGYMASLLSRCRPDCPIFAFTASQDVRQKLNLYWGLIPFRIDFSDDMEDNLRRTFYLLKARGMMKPGDVVISVSDILSQGERQSVEVRRVPE